MTREPSSPSNKQSPTESSQGSTRRPARSRRGTSCGESSEGAKEARSNKLLFYQGEFDPGLRKEESETCPEYHSRLRVLVSKIRYYGEFGRCVPEITGSLPDGFWLIC
ncbi:uncharacterized protein J3R85_017463 [Psidium guajava]|nr:uncharacterized protein J3R85_017463 [Psidium guajava]